MFEVELKAHVDNRNFVIEKLTSFATYDASIKKEDTYWGRIVGGKKIQARVRKEVGSSGKKNYFTYKQKELREGSDGIEIEVNDEKECEIFDIAPVEAFFKDMQLDIFLEKTKSVISWYFADAHIELCTVPPLGDFLEIEILSETSSESDIASCREKILSIFAMCGITEDKIESRYYSEMLRECGKSGES